MKNFPLISIVALTILTISGFVYYFLASFHWGVGEFIIHFHLWLGALFMLYLFFTLPKHIKNNHLKIQNKKFKLFSYLIMISTCITLITGFIHFIPYLSYFIYPVYYKFEFYDVLSKTHMISVIVLLTLFVGHLVFNFEENR